jgi:predicted ATP-grasp superfamily ATP-dependent carboligase
MTVGLAPSDLVRAAPVLLAPRRPPRVLVLGIIPTLTWGVARSLSRAGIRPVVAAWQRVSPLAVVRDCAGFVPLTGVRWIDGELDPELIRQVDRAAARWNADIVVPADLDATLLLARHGGGLTRARACAIPDADTIVTLHNKWKLSRVMDRLGVPYPETELCADADALARTSLPFPIITKPPDRDAGVGFQIHRTRQELTARLERGKLAAAFPVIAQRFVPGWDLGFSFLASHGHLVAYSICEHKRNGERRFYEDARLRAAIQRLVEETRYHGVGHFDARYDPARDDFRVLELNPRFWGSLLYSTNAGVNYPELLVRLEDLPLTGLQTAAHGKVLLPPYERGVALATQLAERAHGRVFRLLGL